MTPFGYFLLVYAFFVGHEAVKGRGLVDLAQDSADLLVAVVSGDTARATAVLARDGSTSLNNVSSTGDVAAESSVTGSALLATAHRLGDGKRYVLGAVGPDAYDCSGLVWRSLRELGYPGPRFTSRTLGQASATFATRVETPAVGDIVLWPSHHVGIIDGPDSTFSALNPRRGIGSNKTSGLTKQLGGVVQYYRPNFAVGDAK